MNLPLVLIAMAAGAAIGAFLTWVRLAGAYDRGWEDRDAGRTLPDSDRLGDDPAPLTLPTRGLVGYRPTPGTPDDLPPPAHLIPDQIVGPVPSARPTYEQILATMHSACRLWQMNEHRECEGCVGRAKAVMVLLYGTEIDPPEYATVATPPDDDLLDVQIDHSHRPPTTFAGDTNPPPGPEFEQLVATLPYPLGPDLTHAPLAPVPGVGHPAYRCEGCHGEPYWHIVREGDVVTTWADDRHLAAVCYRLQRDQDHGRTRLVITPYQPPVPATVEAADA